MSWNVMPLIFVENFMLIISNLTRSCQKLSWRILLPLCFLKFSFFSSMSKQKSALVQIEMEGKCQKVQLALRVVSNHIDIVRNFHF